MLSFYLMAAIAQELHIAHVETPWIHRAIDTLNVIEHAALNRQPPRETHAVARDRRGRWPIATESKIATSDRSCPKAPPGAVVALGRRGAITRRCMGSAPPPHRAPIRAARMPAGWQWCVRAHSP